MVIFLGSGASSCLGYLALWLAWLYETRRPLSRLLQFPDPLFSRREFLTQLRIPLPQFRHKLPQPCILFPQRLVLIS